MLLSRRCVLAGLSLLPGLAGAATSASASTPAHADLADALFDLYAAQSVRLSVANALRQRPPGTEQLLAEHVPTMVRSLNRHRTAFSDAMGRALSMHVPADAVARLVASLRATPPALDDTQRRMLFETDAEFRREAQSVIGAMTGDIALMIATSLAETNSRTPNPRTPERTP